MIVLPLLFLCSLPPSLLDGDQEFVRMNYSGAAAIYHSVLIDAPDSASVLWRLARVYVCMADVSPIEQQIDLYRQADEYAQRCVHADSLISEGYAWRAAALGNIAMSEGGKTKVKLTHVIKHELDAAIALNPENDIAYSILGSFYLALGNMSWIERQLANIFLGTLPDGGYEEAEQALKRAIVIAPNVVRHHFELGRVYMEMDRNREAMEEFRIAISLPVQLGVDPYTQESARKLAKEIQEG